LAILSSLATAWLLWPLQPGSELPDHFIPTASATPTRVVVHRKPTPTFFIPTTTPQPLIHVVEEGEVLGLIAEQYDTTMEAILEANGLSDADLVSIGQELVIVDAAGITMTVSGVTLSPSATPTAEFDYAAPVLVGPHNDAVFRGREARIRLMWTSVAILGQDEWYEVEVWSLGHTNTRRLWTKMSSQMVPASWYPAEESNTLYWNVSVIRRANRQRIPLSPTSQIRGFDWY
jgi:LysM repeat protein